MPNMKRPKAHILIPMLSAFCLAFAVPAPLTLREAAQHCGILIGTAVRPAQLSESAYAATLAREFNMLEPEDALKWEVLRPDSQSFDFSQADRVVAFALRHGMKVRGHTLVWHRQNPTWLTTRNYRPEELSALLERHIKTVVGHYRGQIFAWDVANEAFDEGAREGRLRSTIWFDQPGIGLKQQGPAYLARCFRWAHEADPQALLFYNEAESEELNPKSDAVYAMVRDFKRQGVPIDGVGFQMHLGDHPPGHGLNFREHQPIYGARPSGSHHRDGCLAKGQPQRRCH
jgi:endo-1,4-beta-xylanase